MKGGKDSLLRIQRFYFWVATFRLPACSRNIECSILIFYNNIDYNQVGKVFKIDLKEVFVLSHFDVQDINSEFLLEIHCENDRIWLLFTNF